MEFDDRGVGRDSDEELTFVKLIDNSLELQASSSRLEVGAHKVSTLASVRSKGVKVGRNEDVGLGTELTKRLRLVGSVVFASKSTVGGSLTNNSEDSELPE